MLNLPKHTVLGELRIVSTFLFFDIPRLFLCQNNIGSLFLSLSIFDDDNLYDWLYLPISNDRFSALILKNMYLREAFLNPEDGHLFSVRTDFYGKAEIQVKLPTALLEEDLPEVDVYLESNQKINFGLGKIDAKDAALSSRREIYNLHLYPWDTQLPELDIREFGCVLTSFQDLVDALGQYCKGEPTIKGAISADILEATKFRATQIFNGSFGIQMRSKVSSDLFYSSLVSDAILELTNLLEARDNEDNISNKLHKLQGRVASKYRLFLKEVSKLDSPMKLEWGSPNTERGKIITLTKNEIKKAFDLVSKIDIDMTESVTFKAELLGLDTKTKRYRVRHLVDNEDYVGKIADESLNQVSHSEINGLYQVTLKKIIQTNSSSGSEFTKWLLIGLTPEAE